MIGRVVGHIWWGWCTIVLCIRGGTLPERGLAMGW